MHDLCFFFSLKKKNEKINVTLSSTSSACFPLHVDVFKKKKNWQNKKCFGNQNVTDALTDQRCASSFTTRRTYLNMNKIIWSRQKDIL